jgi:hypothetical protein
MDTDAESSTGELESGGRKQNSSDYEDEGKDGLGGEVALCEAKR